MASSYWIRTGFRLKIRQCECLRTGFELNSRPPNQGKLRMNSNWTRTSVNAIGLTIFNRSICKYGVECITCIRFARSMQQAVLSPWRFCVCIHMRITCSNGFGLDLDCEIANVKAIKRNLEWIGIY